MVGFEQLVTTILYNTAFAPSRAYFHVLLLMGCHSPPRSPPDLMLYNDLPCPNIALNMSKAA